MQRISKSTELGGDRSPDGYAESPPVFINYRHADTQTAAWMLYARLSDRLGPRRVFFDHGTLKPGMRWLDEIRSALLAGGVLLALIGPKWASELATHLQRGGDDYVVQEIDLALRSKSSTVIPVLVDDAPYPRPDALPPAVRALCDCQGQRLRSDSLLEDIDDLISRLDDLRELPRPESAPPAPAAEAARTTAQRPAPTSKSVAPPPDEGHYRLLVQHAANLVVFLGTPPGAERPEAWSPGSNAIPDDRELARYLAARAGLAPDGPQLAAVAEYAGAIFGEMELFDWVRQALSSDGTPGQADSDLAGLPARLGRRQMIVTPRYDAALEKAFRQAGEDFDVAMYMAPGTELEGKFVHLPWIGQPQNIERPNEYTGLPIVAEDHRMLRTLIVRISGAVDDSAVGFSWQDNYVMTEDQALAVLSGRSPGEVVPAQILAKLRRANYLFLGYNIGDWRLRVFLQRIWQGPKLGRAKYWAVEPNPDALEKELWQRAGVTLYQSSLAGYLKGLYDYIDAHPVEAQP